MATSGGGSGGASGGGPSWLGLLRWSVQHNDGTQPPNFSAASAQDREWLRAALEESVRDDNMRMKEIVARLAELADGPPAAHPEEMLTLLEEAHDICEQVDNAASFVRLGGGRLMLALAGRAAEPSAARCEALAVLGACAQNNPPAQEVLWRGGAVEQLKIVLTQADSGQVRLRALGALSCVVRGCRAAEDALLASPVPPARGAIQLLEGVLEAGPAAAQAKVFFLVRALIDTDGVEEPRAAILWPMMGCAVEATTKPQLEVRESALRLLRACASIPAPPGGNGGARARLLRDYGPILQAAALARRLAMEQALSADLQVDLGLEGGGGGGGAAGAGAVAGNVNEEDEEEAAHNRVAEVTLWQELSTALGVDLGLGMDPNAGLYQAPQQQPPLQGGQEQQDAQQQPVLLLGAPPPIPPTPGHMAEAP